MTDNNGLPTVMAGHLEPGSAWKPGSSVRRCVAGLAGTSPQRRSSSCGTETHTRTGVTVLITGAVICAADSVLLTRPYVPRPTTLFIAVTVAAVAGMVVPGSSRFGSLPS